MHEGRGPRIERTKKNEALFREVNERIRRLGEALDADATEFTCECADGTCTENIPVLLPEYERVRRDPRKFLVAPRHVLPELEEVVERQDRYWVVRKHQEVGPAA